METRSMAMKRHIDEDRQSSKSERELAERPGERKKQKFTMGKCATCLKSGRLGAECPKGHGKYRAIKPSEPSETNPLKEGESGEDYSNSEDNGNTPYELDSECNSSRWWKGNDEFVGEGGKTLVTKGSGLML
jgi:hypothetical protein